MGPPGVKPVVNAQTSDGDVAAARSTSSSFAPGNGALVHLPPLRRQAAGSVWPLLPSNAQPVAGLVATTAVNRTPWGPPGTDFAMCQARAVAGVVLASVVAAPRHVRRDVDRRRAGHPAPGGAFVLVDVLRPPHPDLRPRRSPAAPDGRARSDAVRRRARLPADYQASAPELVALELGARQRARIRVSFSQLLAVVAPGAGAQTAMASAANLPSLAASFGGVMSERMNGAAAGLSWLSWAGRYDLDLIRPGNAQTDPGAALASRTCPACGATYRSELATACSHCRAERPLPWGLWRLASITAVE